MAKKRNLFKEIREGLEAHRDRPDTLPTREGAEPAADADFCDARNRARVRDGLRKCFGEHYGYGNQLSVVIE